MKSQQPRERRLSVKDRIKALQQKETENGGNKNILKTFAASPSSSDTSIDDPEILLNTIEQNKTNENTKDNPIPNPNPNPNDDVETSTIAVKDRIHRLNVAELCAESERKKEMYLKTKHSAKLNIQKLQIDIEKNRVVLQDFTKKSPEDRSPDIIERVDQIRAEQGEKRNGIRRQLTRQVLSARERIQSLLLEQKALHMIYEEQHV